MNSGVIDLTFRQRGVLIVDSAVRTLVLERHWPTDGGTEVAA